MKLIAYAVYVNNISGKIPEHDANVQHNLINKIYVERMIRYKNAYYILLFERSKIDSISYKQRSGQRGQTASGSSVCDLFVSYEA